MSIVEGIAAGLGLRGAFDRICDMHANHVHIVHDQDHPTGIALSHISGKPQFSGNLRWLK